MRDPYSLEAEQSVLGAMMIDPSLIDLLAADLAEKDFYWQDNADIFKAVLELNSLNRNIDFLTVADHIGTLSSGDSALAYAAQIQNGTPSVANAEQYARIVRERSLDRALIAAAQEIHQIAHSTMDTPDKIGQAQAEILAIDGEAATAETVDAYDVLCEHIDLLEKRMNQGDTISGICTGLEDLDKHTGGLQPEQLVIIAGRPKMGKTTLAMDIVRNASLRQAKEVLVISLEMSNRQLMDRLIAAEGSIPLDAMHDGSVLSDHTAALTVAANNIKQSRMTLSDRPGLTMRRIRSMARRHKRKHGLDLMMIDHLGLLDADDPKMNQVAKVTEISRQAKLLAKELKIPVILLSQLNRALEQRPNKRPVPSDLRDSGSIEQDADMVIFVYRDEVYNPDSDRKGIAEIIIGIARECEAKTFYAMFQGRYARFAPLEAGAYIPDEQDAPPQKRGARGMQF
jgi:replicative DNA helicase